MGRVEGVEERGKITAAFKQAGENSPETVTFAKVLV